MSKQEQLELDFLRFFYDRVRDSLGPADDDIYRAIKDEYTSDGSELPDDYKPEEE